MAKTRSPRRNPASETPATPAASTVPATERSAAPGRRRVSRDKSPKAGASTLPLSREESAASLVSVMGDQLAALCHVVERVADAGTDVDAVLGHLATLASRPKRPARKGQERAWLLSALLRLLGASAAEPDPRRLPTLRKLRPSPRRIEIRPERIQRLQDALQGITPPERASVVLVVQEGLSLEQASRVLGHSRQEFAEAYSDALEALDDDHLETLMGH
jgi:hypothetical protein